MPKDKILVIGANGQVGSELTKSLRAIHGQENVIGADLKVSMEGNNHLPFEILDASDASKLAFLVERYRITQIYHLAAIMSEKGENNPVETWKVNMNCLFNVLEMAAEKKLRKVFIPSAITVFGSNIFRSNTPQDAIRTPETVLGMSKVASENWCSYYFKRYGVDVRSIRFPGIIGYQAHPRSATTDYAIEIFQKAVQGELFHCLLQENTRLPMLYIADAVDATLQVMEAPKSRITIRSSYNISGMSFTPSELAKEIRRYYPDFKIDYHPDFRQQIADSWPESVDDSKAREDWDWKPKYDIAKMTVEMIQRYKGKS